MLQQSTNKTSSQIGLADFPTVCSLDGPLLEKVKKQWPLFQIKVQIVKSDHNSVKPIFKLLDGVKILSLGHAIWTIVILWLKMKPRLHFRGILHCTSIEFACWAMHLNLEAFVSVIVACAINPSATFVANVSVSLTRWYESELWTTYRNLDVYSCKTF